MESARLRDSLGERPASYIKSAGQGAGALDGATHPTHTPHGHGTQGEDRREAEQTTDEGTDEGAGVDDQIWHALLTKESLPGSI